MTAAKDVQALDDTSILTIFSLGLLEVLPGTPAVTTGTKLDTHIEHHRDLNLTRPPVTTAD